MQTRPQSGRLVFLGQPTPWAQQFLTALQTTGSFEVQIEGDTAKYLSTPVPKNRATVAMLEHGPQSIETIHSIRQTGRRMILIWIGKSFTKQDLFFAMNARVHSILENPVPDDAGVLDQVRKAIARAEDSERGEELIFSIKSVLLQLGSGDAGPLLTELKTGLAKFEKTSLQSEFLGSRSSSSGETKLPFHQGESLSEALMTVQDLERTGVLWVKGKEPNQQGTVGFLQGRPVSASCGDARSLKAIYRMFTWSDPQFTFNRNNADSAAVEEQFPISLREICLEGESLHTRFQKIKSQVPPPSLRLQLDPSSLHTGTQMNRHHFDTLSSVVELGKVSQILDYNPLPDVVLYECLIHLKRNAVIKVA